VIDVADAEISVALIALVALIAGVIRGFCGFGGPAFIVAILTIYFTPDVIVSKVFVVDLVASIYLFVSIRKEIPWRSVVPVTIPTIVMLPLGQWLLIEIDPYILRRLIAIVIALCSLIMLCGWRYKKVLPTAYLVALGLCGGVIFGATYLALVIVAGILLGPYEKRDARGIIVAWAFFTAMSYAVVSGISGTTQWQDYKIAFPGAVLYLLGTWAGSHGFNVSSETLYRNIALILLLFLSLVSFLN